MSPLTKLFVVLLVIVSMLNAAAIVVFVNKAQPLQPALDAKEQLLAAERSKEAADLEAAQSALGNYNTEAQLRERDHEAGAAAMTMVQNQLNEANVTIARLQGDNTNLQAGLNTANSTMELVSATANKLQEQVTALRASNDDLARQNGEFSRHNAELTSTGETLQARLQDTQEQLQDAKDTTQKYAAFLKTHNYDPADVVAEPAPVGPGAPAINGVVRDKTVINGNTFVTISVGSADGVVKGMKFDVVNGPDYMGTITVDTVDTDDAVGRVEGPRVPDVQKGNDVTTQLRGS